LLLPVSQVMGPDLQRIMYPPLTADSNTVNKTVECLETRITRVQNGSTFSGEKRIISEKVQKSGIIPENPGGLATLPLKCSRTLTWWRRSAYAYYDFLRQTRNKILLRVWQDLFPKRVAIRWVKGLSCETTSRATHRDSMHSTPRTA